LRFHGTIKKRTNELLNATEEELAEKIRSKLRKGTSTARLESLLKAVRTTRRKAWSEINEEWAKELSEFAQMEAEEAQKMVVSSSPVVVETLLPAADSLKAIVSAKPFEGRTLKAWASSIQNEDLRRIEAQIRRGVVQGETPQQIARRVVGTARLKGTDGVTQITRNNAAAITRTAVNHIGTEARQQFYNKNRDLFDREQYLATLDARTTAVCRANDGKTFPMGEGPMPPLHFQCRSLRVPTFDGDILADRPAKPTTEKMLLREYAKKNGLDRVPKSRSGLPYGHKGKFDQFKRQRVRELTERVPESVSYNDWLARQSREFQEDVLGKKKARLYKDGKLTLDKFVNRNGDELTLAELKSQYPDAWKRAGLADEFDTVGFTEDEMRQGVLATLGGNKRLYNTVIDDLKRDWNMDDVPLDAPERALPDHELISLRQYAGENYNLVNKYLRGDQDQFMVDEIGENNLRAFIQAGEEGLDKLPTYKGAVYRGVKSNATLAERIAEQYEPGQTVVESAFTSTSRNPQAAFTGKVQFAINSKTGRDISRISAMGKLEQEVLFKPETRFLVLDKTQRDDGTFVITLEEVD
jgi:SPP1 gp7 family putative phage head morphogenesis protein